MSATACTKCRELQKCFEFPAPFPPDDSYNEIRSSVTIMSSCKSSAHRCPHRDDDDGRARARQISEEEEEEKEEEWSAKRKLIIVRWDVAFQTELGACRTPLSDGPGVPSTPQTTTGLCKRFSPR